jgi:hypothetical protein
LLSAPLYWSSVFVIQVTVTTLVIRVVLGVLNSGTSRGS